MVGGRLQVVTLMLSVFVSMTPRLVVFYDLNNSIYHTGKHHQHTHEIHNAGKHPQHVQIIHFIIVSDVDGVHLHSYIAPVDHRHLFLGRTRYGAQAERRSDMTNAHKR
ncbi:MAG: hypothetical protein IPJ13_20535 [Saprospiraceae bacterium]|nr:hypothetical protein [Saprospiraceae bacterium]